jgi:hypothetical protein
MNILEDVRIEKLIKRKYPGLRKRMNEGYKQLNDKDFFGVSKVASLDALNLIDRINLYFKAGFQCGVKFDQDEKNFVNRAERTETIDEVIQLAHDIYAYAKEQAEKKKQQRAEAGEDDGDDDAEYIDDLDLDLDGDDWHPEEDDASDEEAEKSAKGKGAGQEQTEEDLESVTDRAFEQRLEELADQSTEYRYHKIEPTGFDPIIGFKQVLKDLDFDFEKVSVGSYYHNRVYGSKTEQQFTEKQLSAVNKFKVDSVSSVNYLIKEFEMKKSAQLYKRAQVSKIGSLDMRKVYAYQLQDDLFKRVTTLPQGKNHGMIMMLDWSGSMADVIEDTIKQVINLAMFCNKAQIPYRVFAFTSQYVDRDSDAYHKRYQKSRELRDRYIKDQTDSVLDSGSFNLLELFSNRMTTTEFNTMIKKLLDPRVFWHSGYDLGGTPLNEALLWTYNNIGEYMKNNRIEKMNFITLSDGCGGSMQASGGINRYSYGAVKIKNLVRDPVTKKTYPFNYDSGQQTETLLKMIKDRYDIRTIGFYICSNRRSSLSSAIRDNLYGFAGNEANVIDEMRKEFKRQGFYSMQGTGRDDLFIVPAESTKIDESELKVESDMSARKLATSLGKFLNTKKTSRILLSRFIGYVA